MYPNLPKWQQALACKANLMMLMILLGCVFISFESIYGKETPAKYSQARIYITSKNDILALQKAGLGFDHIDYQGTYFETVLNNNEVDLLKKTAWPYDIVIDDLEAEYRRRPQFSQAQMSALEAEMKKQYGIAGFNFGSMGGYYTFTEVVAELDEMRSLFPALISVKQSIGNSIEGRTIWMVRISDNPDVDESEEEVLYTALHHAREPQSMATVIYFMWHLLENYGSDPNVTFLVQNREMYFVPVVNPDGYVYNETTNPNGGGLWRKNRRNNGGGIFGVDLNRNYGYKWGFDNNGSSPNPSSDTYRGTAAFSEPETRVIRNFAIGHNFTRALNYHSYFNVLVFPWGYLPNFFTPDHALFTAFAQDMTQFNHYAYGTPNQKVGYVANGDANDWFYGEQVAKNKVIAFTTEVGSNSDGFWPSQSRIIPLAEENIYPNLVLAMGLSSPPLPNDWTLKSPATKPSARERSAMASLGGDQVLLFGGWDGATIYDETWVYDLSDNTWTLKSPATQPSAREYPAMASLGGDQVLLFGGGHGSLDDETWVYDLSDNTWTLKSPAAQPSARYFHAMASLGGDQALLFGGFDGANDDETWVYTATPANLALNKTATASSTTSGFPAGNAVDGNNTTHWRSGTASSTTVVWWRVDLGATYNINNVVINWRANFYAKKYTVQVSLTGSGWTAVYADNAGNGGIDNVSFATASARYVRIRMTQNNTSTERLNEVEVYGTSSVLAKASEVKTSEVAKSEVITDYALEQNYPNPFNPSTQINFALPEAGRISVAIYAITGQLVRELVNGEMNAGRHVINWNGRDQLNREVAAGIYLYRLVVTGANGQAVFMQTRRMAFVK